MRNIRFNTFIHFTKYVKR